MEILLIVILILAGILLFIVEFFIIPGTIIPLVSGLFLIAYGNYLAYVNWGSTGASISIISSIFVFIIIIFISLKTKTWDKIALKKEIDSHVEGIDKKVSVGDEGITISRLSPMGKVRINGNDYEAKTLNQMINSGEKIRVIKILNTNVVVEPIL